MKDAAKQSNVFSESDRGQPEPIPGSVLRSQMVCYHTAEPATRMA
jgi:hypothetical protein